MLEFLKLKPETFGLDISDLSLKIVKLKKKKGSLSLVSFGEKEIPQGIIKEGEIKDEKLLVEIIKKAVSEAKGEKIETNYIIASLPEEKAFLQVIQMPRLPEPDLRSAVIFEAENYIPFPIEEVYLDSQIVPPTVDKIDHLDVLIAALPRKIIDSYCFCFKAAGLIPKVLEIESLAIARSLIKNEISPLPLLLIDLGATRTSFIIFSGYSLRFTTSVSISSRKFTEAVSRNLKIDFNEADELKRKYGLGGFQVKLEVGEEKSEKRVENSRIFEALLPILSDLVEEIEKYLIFYQTHDSHEHLTPNGRGIEKILLSGSGANLKGLGGFLSRELRIPVELANPWINILPEPLKEVPELNYQESLGYTTALGLALRGINESPKSKKQRETKIYLSPLIWRKKIK